MPMCVNGPMKGYLCDEPPAGYQAFKIDDRGTLVLVFVHSLTWRPDRKTDLQKALALVRAKPKRGNRK